MSTPLRERLYRTEAIILQRHDYGEADRILTLFTPHHGKLKVIAKGSRRTKSRSGPHLDVLARATIDLAKGRTFDVVTSAQSIEMHERLRHDLAAFCAAGYFAELVQHFSQEREAQPALYDLLQRSLAVINDGIDAWPVMRHFELKLLSIVGYGPELYRCINCGKEIEANVNSWSPSLGGMLEPECAGIDPAALPLSVNAQKYIRTIDRSGLANLVLLQPSEMERIEIERALGDYIRYVAEREFGSLRVMSMVGTASFA